MLKFIVFVSLILVGPYALASVDQNAPEREKSSIESPASKFSDAQAARVANWIRVEAPECTTDVILAAAQRFLGELSERPEKLDRLLAEDFDVREVRPAILRALSAELRSPAQAALREEIAIRRVQALLSNGEGAVVSTQTATELISKLRTTSQVYHRRLVEGRMENDDLMALLKKARQPVAGAALVKALAPAAMTAAEIVSEFSRRNQAGSAATRIRTYRADGLVKMADGKEMEMILFRARPNRFRLAVLENGKTQYLLGGGDDGYWHQSVGGPSQSVSQAVMGDKRYLGEFMNPLLGEDGYVFKRLEDGFESGKRVYRVEVKRLDNSQYVSCIDPETFRENARELEKGFKVTFSDFREVGGVTFAFKEETHDAKGVLSTFTLTGLTPNPGLLNVLFEPASSSKPDYFEMEAAIAYIGAASGEERK